MDYSCAKSMILVSAVFVQSHTETESHRHYTAKRFTPRPGVEKPMVFKLEIFFCFLGLSLESQK